MGSAARSLRRLSLQGAGRPGADEAKRSDRFGADGGHAAYVYDAQTGEVLEGFSPEQEKAKGGFMLDASIGRSIYLRGGKMLSINLQVQNITNNTHLKTGGYEQNRADRSYDYIFSRNNYYYYANAINAFLNVSLKF